MHRSAANAFSSCSYDSNATQSTQTTKQQLQRRTSRAQTNVLGKFLLFLFERLLCVLRLLNQKQVLLLEDGEVLEQVVGVLELDLVLEVVVVDQLLEVVAALDFVEKVVALAVLVFFDRRAGLVGVVLGALGAVLAVHELFVLLGLFFLKTFGADAVQENFVLVVFFETFDAFVDF